MAVDTVSFDWTWQGEARSKEVRVGVPDGVAANAPVVVLVHGTGGANLRQAPSAGLGRI
jgi:poly(3-hydroxybutyrate) depolymerase